MAPARRNRKRGSAMLEFTLTAIPLILTLVSSVTLAIGMWNYHSAAEAVNLTARSAAAHGAGCAGQTCATTVDTVARFLAAHAVGIGTDQMNVTLVSSASTVNCNPLNICFGNSTAWPSVSGNTAGTDIAISATFPILLPVAIQIAGGATHGPSSLTLGAKARQVVMY